MSLHEYYLALERFDWFFEYSDDPGVYRRGIEAQKALERTAGTSPEHAKLLADYRAHIFSGPAFGKPKADKPPKPVA